MSGNWFRLSGTASRAEAWAWTIAALSAIGALYYIESLPHDPPALLRIPIYILVAILMLGQVTALVRRLHDSGKSGWWMVLGFVPVLGLAVMLYTLFARPRLPDLNRWAPRPAYAMGFTLLFALCTLFASRAFWTPYWIPYGSMKPTLLIGDYIAVLRVSDYAPERGDIIVFRHPARPQNYFVKRVIGLPGDQAQIVDGIVLINGTAIPQNLVGSFNEVFEPQGQFGSRPRCENGPVGAGGTCSKSQLNETLPNGRSHFILNAQDGGFADNTAVFTVPERNVFVLGDNRDNSMDSRFAVGVGGIGMVPVENVTGKAPWVLFSYAGRWPFEVWTWRSNRYFIDVE